MVEVIEELSDHKNVGPVCVTLLQTLKPDESSQIIGATQRQIREACYQENNPKAQLFEEGPVQIAISERSTPGSDDVPLGYAATYVMDITPIHKLGFAPRMHAHLGQRSLEIITDKDASIEVWSTDDVELGKDSDFSRKKGVHPESGQQLYCVTIPPNSRASVQIPSKTTHQFIPLNGNAIIRSEHPNEVAEQNELEMHMNSRGETLEHGEMADLTIFFGDENTRTPLTKDNRVTMSEGAREAAEKILSKIPDISNGDYLGAYAMADYINKNFGVRLSPRVIHGAIHKLLDGEEIKDDKQSNTYNIKRVKIIGKSASTLIAHKDLAEEIKDIAITPSHPIR